MKWKESDNTGTALFLCNLFLRGESEKKGVKASGGGRKGKGRLFRHCLGLGKRESMRVGR